MIFSSKKSQDCNATTTEDPTKLTSRADVYRAIDIQLANNESWRSEHADEDWSHRFGLGDYMSHIRMQLHQAEYVSHMHPDDGNTMNMMLAIAAKAIECMERYGIPAIKPR